MSLRFRSGADGKLIFSGIRSFAGLSGANRKEEP